MYILTIKVKLFPPFLTNNQFQSVDTRGHKYKVTKNRVKTQRRLHAFSQRSIMDWNNLPDDVVNSSSLNAFKANLEKVWKLKNDKYNPEQLLFCPCSR